MTDNEIIKTLECLCGGGDSCTECAYHKKYRFDECRKQVAKDALDLINRQQVEVQQITEKFNCQQTVYADLSKIIKKQKEEIVRLEYENEILSKNADTAFQDGLNEAQDLYAEQIKDEIKSEAIKELIDKLEPDHTFEIQRDDGYWEKVVRLESIKTIAKELVGDKK